MLRSVKEDGDFDPKQAAQDILPLLQVPSNVLDDDYLPSNSHHSFPGSVISTTLVCVICVVLFRAYLSRIKKLLTKTHS